jgi:hypothetical protein
MRKTRADKLRTLDNIANGIHAANKVQQIYRSRLNKRQGEIKGTDNLDTLNEIIRILTSYSPNTHRGRLNNALIKGGELSNTYHSFKQHFSLMRSQRMNRDLFIKTLDVIKPVVDSRKRNLLDKALKIHEILNS